MGITLPMPRGWKASNRGLATPMRQLMDLLHKLGHAPPVIVGPPPVIVEPPVIRPRKSWWEVLTVPRAWPSFAPIEITHTTKLHHKRKR